MKVGRLISVLLVIVLFFMSTGGVAGAAKARGPSPWEQGLKLGVLKKVFVDEDEAPWAAGYMAKMKLKGIMKGYPGEKFRPNVPVPRVEVVVATVRLMGFEEEALQRPGAVLPFSDSAEIYKRYPWAVGYLATGITRGIIDGTADAFKPGTPATRVWAVEAIVRALGLKAEAESKMSTSLPFADRAEIPASKVGYVAVALDRGIVVGYGTTFRPNQPVKRAELAAMIDRCEEVTPPQEGFEVRGIVTGVNVTNPAITLRVLDANWWKWPKNLKEIFRGEWFTETVTIPVSQDALILVDKKAAGLGDIQAGYRAVILKNSAGKAVLVDAKSGPTLPNWPNTGVITKTGTVRQIELGSTVRLTIRDWTGVDWTYAIASDCEVLRNGVRISPGDIRVGQRVELRVVDERVTRVTVLEEVVTADKEGVVTEVITGATPQRITIRLSNGSLFTAAIAQGVVVRKNGVAITLSDVKVGDQVEITLTDGYVSRIEVQVEVVEVEGTVTEVYTGTPRRITVRKAGGSLVSVAVDSNARVTFRGENIAFSSLRVGDCVEVRIADSVAFEIVVTERPLTEVNGTVTQVQTGAEARIWIRRENSILSYAVSSNVQVTFRNEEMRLDDVVPGDQVTLSLADSRATAIEIRQRPESEIQGTLLAATQSTAGRTVTVRDSAGNEMTYKVSASATITRGGASLNFSDLSQGWTVVVRVEGNVVTRITVLS